MKSTRTSAGNHTKLKRAVELVAKLCTESPRLCASFVEVGLISVYGELLRMDAPTISLAVCVALPPLMNKLPITSNSMLEFSVGELFMGLQSFEAAVGNDRWYRHGYVWWVCRCPPRINWVVPTHRLATAYSVLLQRCNELNPNAVATKLPRAFRWLVSVLAHSDHREDRHARSTITQALTYAVMGSGAASNYAVLCTELAQGVASAEGLSSQGELNCNCARAIVRS